MHRFSSYVIVVLILQPVNLKFFNLSVSFSPHLFVSTASSNVTVNLSTYQALISKLTPTYGVGSANNSCEEVKKLPPKQTLFKNNTRKLNTLALTTSKFRKKSVKMVRYVTETLVNTGTIPTAVNSTVTNEQSLPKTAATPSLGTTLASVNIRMRKRHTVKIHQGRIEKPTPPMKIMKPQDVEKTAVTRRDREQLQRAHRVNVTVRRGLRYGSMARPYSLNMYSRGPKNKWPNKLSGKIRLNQRAVRTLSTYPFFPGGTTPTREKEPTEILMCGIAKCLQLEWKDLDEDKGKLRQKSDTSPQTPGSTTTTTTATTATTSNEELDLFVMA